MNNSKIIVCGQEVEVGATVVLWTDSKGFNGYDTSTKYVENRKTGKTEKISGKRYSSRFLGKPTLKKLQGKVSQFFLHHSGLYHSRDTFNVLHNQRRLSVQLILDDDGTIYQTLDLQEKAWHGGANNPVSVGIEIDSRAHAGRLPNAYDQYHQYHYKVDPRNIRMDKIHGQWVKGYEYNDKQYSSLIKLAIALKKTFPKMSIAGQMDFPRTRTGRIIKGKLSNPLQHQGLICHFHNSTNKIDPISFDFDRLLNGVKKNNPYEFSTFNDFYTWFKKQTALKQLGFNPGKIDGLFGPKTKKAIQEFQAHFGLKVDGVWGLKTDYMMDILIKELK